ncbi:MAG: mobilization protein C [Acetobacteraceae bacterium]
MPRQSTTNPERLAKLHQQLARVQRQIRAEQAKEKQQARRDDARRKIIAGALALEHYEKNPGSEFGKILFRLLDEYARPEDRQLFEFLPKREIPPALDATEAAE